MGACPSCGTLYGARAEIEEFAASVVAGRPVERPRSLATSRLKVRFDPGAAGDYRSPRPDPTLTITFRYFGATSFVSLFLALLGLAGLGYVWLLALRMHFYLVASLVSLPVAFYTWSRVSSVFDSLLIRVSGGELFCRQSRTWPRIQARFPVADVTQLFAARTGRLYSLLVGLPGGNAKPLARNIGNPELAVYFERQIELALGIQDLEIVQELPRNAPFPKPASPLRGLVTQLVVLGLLVVAPIAGLRAYGGALVKVAVADEPHQMPFELTKATRVYFTSRIELTENNWPYLDDIPHVLTFKIDILRDGKPVSHLSCDPFKVFLWTSTNHDRYYLHAFWGRMDDCSTQLAPGHYTLRAVRRWKPNMQRIRLNQSVLGLRKD